MIMLAQQMDTTSTTIDPALTGAAVGILSVGFLIILFIAAVLQLLAWAGMWTAASKADQVGILACIPIVQVFIWLIMADKPLWWFVLMFIPLVNFVILIVMMHEISKRFGRGVGTTIGLIFLPFVFWPILGFGSAEYNLGNATD